MGEDGPKAQGPNNERDHVGYRCYLISPDGNIRKRIELQASDDATAIAEGQRELDSSGRTVAEVWCLGRKILTLSKTPNS